MSTKPIKGVVEKAFFLGTAEKRGNESQSFVVFYANKKKKKKGGGDAGFKSVTHVSQGHPE